MNFISTLYIFVLFVLCTPNLILRIPVSNKYFLHCIYGVLFSLVFFFTFKIVLSKQKELFSVKIDSKDGNNPLLGLVNEFLNTKKNVKMDTKNYEVNNKFDYNVDDIANDMGNNAVIQDEMMAQETRESNNLRNINDQDKDNLGWVLTPIKKERTYERTKQKGQYCAANFDTTTPCCNQPNADVPPDYICPEISPFCHGYVAFEKWGICKNEPPSSDAT